MVRITLHIALLLFLAAAGCADDRHGDVRSPDPARSERSPADTVFRAESFLNRGDSLTGLLSGDLDADARPEKIILSLDPGEHPPPGAIANRVVVVSRAHDSAGWDVVATDTSRWTTSATVRDVTGDRIADLVLLRNGGGNDVVATRGAGVVSSDGSDHRRIRTVLSLRHGAPTFIEQGKGVILVNVHKTLWPPLVPRTASIEYLDDVLRFREGIFRSDPETREKRFERLAQQALQKYRSMSLQYRGDTLRSIDSVQNEGYRQAIGSSLFIPVALVLLYTHRGHSSTVGESFWQKERNFLQRRMPKEQFDILDSMSNRLLAGDDPATEAME